MMRIAFLLSVVAFACLTAAQTAEAQDRRIAGTSEIVAATVFPQHARVTRALVVPVPAGESTVVVSDLPSGLIPTFGTLCFGQR